MKCKCGSSKLMAYSSRNLDYILYYVESKWIISDPSAKSFYFNSKEPFIVSCLDCKKYWKEEKISQMVSPSLNSHQEITLDLDKTLYHVITDLDELNLCDFSFKYYYEENKFFNYYAYKRPHLDNFIKILLTHFNKINIFTAAQPEYAQELVKNLNIPENKMGYLKTIKDTYLDRVLDFEKEYVKAMDNSLMIEDKPFVVRGYNNNVIKVDPFYYEDKKDKELLRVIKLLSQKEKIIEAPQKFNGEIQIFVRDLIIKLKDIPYNKYQEILKIKPKSKDELNQQYIIVQESPPTFLYKNNKGNFYFSDLDYTNYVQLFNLVKKYTSHKLLSNKEYDQLLIDRIKEHKKRMNF